VDLPSVGKARQAPDKVVELVVEEGDRVRLRINQQDAETLSVADVADRVRGIQDDAAKGAQSVPVIISARKDVRYEEVVHIMDVLQRGGVVRVGLSVRTSGG
jgi:biopolymer transport protein TolR